MTDDARTEALRLQAQLLQRELSRSQSSGVQTDVATGRPMAALPPRADTPTPPTRREPATVQDRLQAAGETVGEIGRSATAGLARGAAELVGLPGTIDDAIMAGIDRAGLLNEDAPRTGSVLSGQSIRRALSAATDGGTEYRSPTTAGRLAGTAGEFVGGGGVASPRAAASLALAGAASEGAGMLTEGTPLEGPARLGAGIATMMATGPRSPRVRPIGAEDEAARQAETLIRQGIRPTAGQVMRSGTLQRMEGTVSPLTRQFDEVTRAAMRSIGSAATRATPRTLRQAEQQITGAMDDALRGVSFRPSVAVAQAADDVASNYLTNAPAGAVVPRVRNIVDEIMEAATSPQGRSIDLETLRRWRSSLGRMTQSSDEATRTAAHELRQVINDATEQALRAAGRADDVAALAQSRVQYENFMAIRDASTRAGAESGVISPTQLNQAVIRVQGRSRYALNRGTGLEETSRAAAATLRPMPTVEAGGIRRLPYVPEMGAAGAGAYLGYQTGELQGALIGGLAGTASVPAGQALMRSRQVQNFLLDPRFATGNALRVVPGVMAGN